MYNATERVHVCIGRTIYLPYNYILTKNDSIMYSNTACEWENTWKKPFWIPRHYLLSLSLSLDKGNQFHSTWIQLYSAWKDNNTNTNSTTNNNNNNKPTECNCNFDWINIYKNARFNDLLSNCVCVLVLHCAVVQPIYY